MKYQRASPNAFLVNDTIYVFGGCKEDQTLNHGGLVGEKYALSGNKWREVKPKNLGEGEGATYGPAALLYE